jgi:hypothetical protein
MTVQHRRNLLAGARFAELPLKASIKMDDKQNACATRVPVPD